MPVLHAVTLAAAHRTLYITPAHASAAGMGHKRSSKNDLSVSDNLIIGYVADGMVVVGGQLPLTVLLMVIVPDLGTVEIGLYTNGVIISGLSDFGVIAHTVSIAEPLTQGVQDPFPVLSFHHRRKTVVSFTFVYCHSCLIADANIMTHSETVALHRFKKNAIFLKGIRKNVV
jgi:hypothetical protein